MLLSCSGPDVPVHPPLLLSGTPLDRYAKYLKLCYNIPFTSTKWPHLNARKYVNLTVVNNAVYAGRKEQLMFRQQQVLGSIEDNLDPIAVGDILKPNTVYDDKQTKCFFTQVLIIGDSSNTFRSILPLPIETKGFGFLKPCCNCLESIPLPAPDVVGAVAVCIGSVGLSH